MMSVFLYLPAWLEPLLQQLPQSVHGGVWCAGLLCLLQSLCCLLVVSKVCIRLQHFTAQSHQDLLTPQDEPLLSVARTGLAQAWRCSHGLLQPLEYPLQSKSMAVTHGSHLCPPEESLCIGWIGLKCAVTIESCQAEVSLLTLAEPCACRSHS